MDKTIAITFNVFIYDEFLESVRDYYEYRDVSDVTDEDIREYLEANMNPASSKVDVFEVEGGDTDGWFIQSYEDVR